MQSIRFWQQSQEQSRPSPAVRRERSRSPHDSRLSQPAADGASAPAPCPSRPASNPTPADSSASSRSPEQPGPQRRDRPRKSVHAAAASSADTGAEGASSRPRDASAGHHPLRPADHPVPADEPLERPPSLALPLDMGDRAGSMSSASNFNTDTSQASGSSFTHWLPPDTSASASEIPPAASLPEVQPQVQERHQPPLQQQQQPRQSNLQPDPPSPDVPASGKVSGQHSQHKHHRGRSEPGKASLASPASSSRFPLTPHDSWLHDAPGSGGSAERARLGSTEGLTDTLQPGPSGVAAPSQPNNGLSFAPSGGTKQMGAASSQPGNDLSFAPSGGMKRADAAPSQPGNDLSFAPSGSSKRIDAAPSQPGNDLSFAPSGSSKRIDATPSHPGNDLSFAPSGSTKRLDAPARRSTSELLRSKAMPRSVAEASMESVEVPQPDVLEHLERNPSTAVSCSCSYVPAFIRPTRALRACQTDQLSFIRLESLAQLTCQLMKAAAKCTHTLASEHQGRSI